MHVYEGIWILQSTMDQVQVQIVDGVTCNINICSSEELAEFYRYSYDLQNAVIETVCKFYCFFHLPYVFIVLNRSEILPKRWLLFNNLLSTSTIMCLR